MEDYHSKRTGEQIEALLDIVQQGGTGGDGEVQKTTEAEITAMGFTKNQGTITGITMNGASKGTSGVVDLGTVITEHQDISGKADSDSLATVATSGSYNDLTNKPTIPSAVTESTVSGWGFTKNTGTYSKPSGGIPASDLASAVQTSLGKADTALQSYTEQYTGTVTGVTVNGTTYSPTNGVVDLGTISGGSNTKEIVSITNGIIEELEPNKIYILESHNSTFEIQSIVAPGFGSSGEYAEYTVILSAESNSGNEDETPTIILPEGVYWANGVIPDITEQGIYELSIVSWAGHLNSSYNAVLTKFKPI